MIEIIPYQPGLHRHHIDAWLSHREMSPSLGDDLPAHSYLAVQDEKILGAAGLLKTDGQDAFLMGLITNPEEEIFLRSEAIDSLTQYIIRKSKCLGFRRLFSWSRNEGVIERSKKHGFEIIPQVMIGLDLRGK